MQARRSGWRTGLLAHRRSGGACACARVRIATARSLRAIRARRAAAACWQHSGTATTTHACTWRSMHAAGARRSRATGSSFGMNSRAPQRADALVGADPANRAPLAHARQLAGRSWPRVRRRGARFGDGLETDHLNGRPGGREATRCAVRPLRGAGDTSLLDTLRRAPGVSTPRFRHLQLFILPRLPRTPALPVRRAGSRWLRAPPRATRSAPMA